MDIEIIHRDKNDVEFKLDNLTIAELMRFYLNECGVKFAAWKREHPSKPIIMKIQTSSETIKKAVSDTISVINNDIDEIIASVKKSK